LAGTRGICSMKPKTPIQLAMGVFVIRWIDAIEGMVV
jgi:hypothetical protein